MSTNGPARPEEFRDSDEAMHLALDLIKALHSEDKRAIDRVFTQITDPTFVLIAMHCVIEDLIERSGQSVSYVLTRLRADAPPRPKRRRTNNT